MENQNQEAEIRVSDLWGVFKRCWWQMLIVMIVVSMAVFGVMKLTHEDEYTANLTVYVMQKLEEDQSVNSTTQIAIAENLMGDCELLFKSHTNVLNPVIRATNLEEFYDADSLERAFTVKRVDEDARILMISVTTGSAKRSVEIADAIAVTACNYINSLYRVPLLNIVDYAVEPVKISNPISYPLILLIGFGAAVILYVCYLLRFIMDDKINNRDDVERYLGLNMLGVIPNKYDAGRKRSSSGKYYGYHSYDNPKRQS